MTGKTNVLRILEACEAEFRTYEYEGVLSAPEVAKVLGQEPERVFKTLVTVGRSGEHYVFMLPGPAELDLKKAAKVTGEKSIEMVKSRELLPLTGYVHGGCSPIGMKKQFFTAIDETAVLYDSIFFSGGRVGLQVETSLDVLKRCVPITEADLTC